MSSIYRIKLSAVSIVFLAICTVSTAKQIAVSVESLDWSISGYLAIGYSDGSIEIFDGQSNLIKTISTFESRTYVKWDQNGNNFAIADMNGTLRIWNRTTDTITILDPGADSDFISLEPTWNSDLLAILRFRGSGPVTRTFLEIWDTSTSQLQSRVQINLGDRRGTSLSWSPLDISNVSFG